MATRTLDHEILGQIRGIVSEDEQTVQYRGIKFADIPGRWQDPILLSGSLSEKAEPFDATKYGPSCTQNPNGLLFNLSLIGHVSLESKKVEQSELDCLNLVVTVPAGVKKLDGLPVMVWVHGGGFTTGSNSWPQYSLSNFVANSFDIGKPVIGVQINYRLGIFGFLASPELGVTGNYGLKDQACAFKWIQKHIAGFGGDPSRVTAFGESAGSICISALLVSKQSQPLFSRAIMMSGEVTIRRPQSKEWRDAFNNTNAELLGWNKADSELRNILFQTKATDIVNKLPMFQHWTPAVDGDFIPEEFTLGQLADVDSKVGKPEWCKEIMIGDVADDGSVLKARIMDAPNIIERLNKALDLTLDPAEKTRILETYSLTGTLTPEQQFRGLLDLATDLRFHFLAVKVAEGWDKKNNKKSYRYHFHQPNLIEGNYEGLVSHELDVAYLFGNLSSYFSQESQQLGKDMAEVWINFAYGDGWGSKLHDDDILVIGPDERMVFTTPEGYDQTFRHGRDRALQEIGWEKCFRLGEKLQGLP